MNDYSRIVNTIKTESRLAWVHINNGEKRCLHIGSTSTYILMKSLLNPLNKHLISTLEWHPAFLFNLCMYMAHFVLPHRREFFISDFSRFAAMFVCMRACVLLRSMRMLDWWPNVFTYKNNTNTVCSTTRCYDVGSLFIYRFCPSGTFK